MTAIPGDDDYLDPEEEAGDAVTAAYTKYLATRSVLLGIFAVAAVFFTLTDMWFAVDATFYVPQWMIGFLISFVIADIARWITCSRRDRKSRKKDKPLTKGDRTTAALDDMRRQQAELKSRPPFRQRIRQPGHWLKFGIWLVYLACGGLVLTNILGLPLGLGALAAYIAAVTAFGEYGANHLLPRVLSAFAFMDPRPPRDTPEM